MRVASSAKRRPIGRQCATPKFAPPTRASPAICVCSASALASMWQAKMARAQRHRRKSSIKRPSSCSRTERWRSDLMVTSLSRKYMMTWLMACSRPLLMTSPHTIVKCRIYRDQPGFQSSGRPRRLSCHVEKSRWWKLTAYSTMMTEKLCGRNQATRQMASRLKENAAIVMLASI